MPPKKSKLIKEKKVTDSSDESENLEENEIPIISSPVLNLPFEKDKNIKVLKGFYMKKQLTPILLTIPNDDEQQLPFDDFGDQLHSLCKSILTFDQESDSDTVNSFSQIQIKMVQTLAKSELIDGINKMVTNEIQQFAGALPEIMGSFCEAVDDIGSFWSETSDKINRVSLLFAPIVNHFTPFPDLFLEFCRESYLQHLDIYFKEVDLIIAEYNSCRENTQHPQISHVLNFLKGSGLFYSHFVPHFIESVLSVIEPIINQSFETRLFHEYLEISMETFQTEMGMVQVFEDDLLTEKLTETINELIFSSKTDNIFQYGLREILEENEVDGICECSKLARLTNHFPDFIQEMALLFEAEATACFLLSKLNDEDQSSKHKEDPISKILKLYKNLTLFCEKACGPESKKPVRIAFERGFNSQNELTAKLLAISIHKFFSKKSKGEFTDYEMIDRYVDLFKMLSLNDVFETYYTQFLARRLLLMKDKMVKPESYFINQLIRQCGIEYTRRISELIDDRTKSKEIVTSFVNECKNEKNSNINFDIFSCLMISSQNAGSWTQLKSIQMTLPAMISDIISTFSNYFRTRKEGKSLNWNLQLSTVKLKVKNITGLKKIKCSGEVAVILLSFNESSREERLKILRNKLEEIRKEQIEKKRLEKQKQSKKKSKQTKSKKKPVKQQKKNAKKKAQLKQDYDYDESESLDESESIHEEESTSEEELPRMRTRRGMATRQTKSKRTPSRKPSSKSKRSELFDYSDKDESTELEESSNEDEELLYQKEIDSLSLKEEKICKEISDLEASLSQPWTGALTMDELIRMTEAGEDDISVRIGLLKSRKGHKLIIKEHCKQANPDDPSKTDVITKYRINPKCEAPDSVLTLPFILPQLTESDEKRARTTISDNRDSQFDAAVVSILKAERTIDEDSLFNKMVSRMRFNISRDYFDQKLQKLEKKEYLKIDPSRKVHYIPT